LEEKRLLDTTLVVVSGEFGRPSGFDSQGGRGHQGKAFSVVLAGGGLRTGQAVGTTDELCQEILEQPVSVPDLFATILAAAGCNPAETLYDGNRPVPATDRGRPIPQLFG
jgi:arylsulfatase A-like enzyme